MICLPEALQGALSPPCCFCGTLLSHADSILLSRRNKRNNGNFHPPRRSPFCPFSPFCGTLLSHADSILLSRRNKRNNGNLHPPRRSPFCYFCSFCGTLLSHADSIFLSHGNKGNSRNYSYSPPRSSFCPFCGTIYLVRIVFIVPQSSALPLRSSKK